ncbi:UNVERIFIED_CONTAM: Sulfotransferase 1C4 [Trichonephila clavipes]
MARNVTTHGKSKLSAIVFEAFLSMSVPYKLFRGYRVPTGANEDWIEAAAEHPLQPGDLVISSYPKNGTTWLQHIVFLVLKKGTAPQGMMEVIEAMPFLEQDGPSQNSCPMALKYHLPFRLTPFSEDSLYLYIARNPKDTCVSYYHFLKKLPGYHIEDFNIFFEAFLSGEVPYGDHLQHVLGWHEAATLRPNVLFLTYEDLSKDREGAVHRIALFLRRQLQDDTFSGKMIFLSIVSIDITQREGVSFIINRWGFQKKRKHFPETFVI